MAAIDSVTFDQQLNIVELAVTKTFDNKYIGQYAKQIFDENQYENVDEVIDDINNIQDSFIIHSIQEKINENNNCKWNENIDQQKLHTLLIRIFRHKTIEIDKLIDDDQKLPNTLTKCNKYNIFYVATIICNDINKTKPNSINIDNVEKLIINENMNGSVITTLSAKDFMIKAKSFDIKAPKARKLFTSIQSYYDKLKNKDNENVNLNIEYKDNNKTNSENRMKSISDLNNKQILYVFENFILAEIENELVKTHKDNILKCIKDKGLTGKQIKEMNKKTFGKTIHESIGEKKLNGQCMKMHKNMLSFDVKKLEQLSITSPITSPITSLDECNVDHILYMLETFDVLNGSNVLLYKDRIIEYFKEEMIDGKKLNTMNKKQLGSALVAKCDNNKKVNGSAMKLYKCFQTFDFNKIDLSQIVGNKCMLNDTETIQFQMMEEKTEMPKAKRLSLTKNTEIKEIQSVSNEEIIYALKYYILNEIQYKNNDKLTKYKELILKCIKLNEWNGKDINNNINDLEFSKLICEYCDESDLDSLLITIYHKIKGFEWKIISLNNKSKNLLISPTEIALSISTEPLKRNKSSSSQSSIDSVSSYDNLTCDIIAQMARDNAINSLSMTHKKIQKKIIENEINGQIFINKYDINNDKNDNNEFIKFFNEKICGGKKSGKSNKKFEQFRLWLMNEVKHDINIIKQHDMNEFIKFILDGYDEFIAHLFVIENINGYKFMTSGSRQIANKLSNKYNVPRGGITNLCHSIEDKLKNDVARYTQNKISKSKRWCSKKSTRFLPNIIIDNDNDDDDDDDDDDQKQDEWINITTQQFIQIIKKVISDINKDIDIKNKIDSSGIIKEIIKIKMNGRMFKFNTNKSFGIKLETGGINKIYHELIYNKIKTFDLNYYFSTKKFKNNLMIIIDELNDELQKEYINKIELIQCIQAQNITFEKFNKLQDNEWINLLSPCNIDDSINKLLLNRIRSNMINNGQHSIKST